MIFGKKPASQTDEQKQQQIETMYEGAKRSFPDVSELTAEEVKRRIDAGEEMVLVDVRTPEEQATSMIPGAMTTAEFEADESKHHGAPVVCYCTIGGRSGRYTQQLRANGIDAYNMPGAVLAWSHAGGGFERDGEPTKQVNTHGAKFNLVADGYEGVW